MLFIICFGRVSPETAEAENPAGIATHFWTGMLLTLLPLAHTHSLSLSLPDPRSIHLLSSYRAAITGKNGKGKMSDLLMS